MGILGLFREGNRFYQRRAINPYVFGGVGLTFFNPKANYEGETYNLRKYETENVKYGNVSIIFPAGIGLKIKVIPVLNINVEAGYRVTFTDYLDDVSTVYISTDSIQDPVRLGLVDRRVELGLAPEEPGTPRGNPGANDGYAMFNIKVEYYLPTDFIFKPKGQQQGSGKQKYRKIKR